MMTETGTLPIGIEFEGKVHKDFTLRPQILRDSIDVMEDERAIKNESYFGICMLSKQIERLGEIPKEKITPDLIMSLTEVDGRVFMEAKEALEKRLLDFRKENKADTKTPSGDA